MSDSSENEIILDRWKQFRTWTNARIGLQQTGVSIAIKETLDFKLAHAHARDAVHLSLNVAKIKDDLQFLHHPILSIESKAKDRLSYLMRPDLGKQLHQNAIKSIQNCIGINSYDICLIVADGLSATAVHHHIEGVLNELLPELRQMNYSISPIFLLTQGRVAISDEIGVLSRAKISIIFLGERPGLSTPDSLGIYVTYQPIVGNSDAMRNCISNIHANGLSYELATKKLMFLITQMIHQNKGGVMLKENLETEYNHLIN